MSEDQKNIDRLLHQWMTGEASDADIESVIGQEELEKYKIILAEVDDWIPSLESEAFDPQTIIRSGKKAKTIRIGSWPVLSIAASIILLLTFLLFFKDNSKKYQTAYGEHREIILPDGSQVVLSSESSLSWNEKDWGKENREISLEGKAFFEVKKGNPFRVTMKSGQVEVLGTAFDIQHYEEGMLVRCFEGKVRATGSDSQNNVILEAGKSSLLTDDQWEKIEVIELEAPGWIDGLPVFKNVPVQLVIHALESNYGIEVVSDQVELNRRFTGTIPEDNLVLALKIVFDTLGIKYKVEYNKVYLSEY